MIKEVVVSSRQYTFNLGNYSSIHFGPYTATVSREALNEVQFDKLVKEAQKQVADYLTADINGTLKNLDAILAKRDEFQGK